MAATFLLLTVLAQVAVAMTARSVADAAVAATTRRASLPGADLMGEADRLQHALELMVPGATDVTVQIRMRERSVVGRAWVLWAPPGPMVTPITISLRAEVPLADPP